MSSTGPRQPGTALQKRVPGMCKFIPDSIYWPTENGCKDAEVRVTITPGQYTLDRFGRLTGFYFGINGESYDSRSIPGLADDSLCDDIYYDNVGKQDNDESTYPNDLWYNQFDILLPFDVMKCTAAPAFDHDGGATQFRLFEGSIPAGQNIQISNKNPNPQGDPKYIPNVQEMITFGYIAIRVGPITPPTYKGGGVRVGRRRKTRRTRAFQKSGKQRKHHNRNLRPRRTLRKRAFRKK